ncbi:hypothetical protein SODALDRAFT_335393 [Sodiomyces alkalinus F11]|uniref:Uncharacterized protein n=1 Tax=Sodiomyces alkalinus (strain CBS 110278 / VKM F-3762 / F11) TaxID=1314773 RepID=A0A3N2PP74_SODAK|nr:hypothetical protein SODALDRAFT_335393 [Sodiomyces alkalinus F11]ROT36299.1 hypothetical protein SODALDRAFT_335393 [Sodiomyces alkalinus F11]
MIAHVIFLCTVRSKYLATKPLRVIEWRLDMHRSRYERNKTAKSKFKDRVLSFMNLFTSFSLSVSPKRSFRTFGGYHEVLLCPS